MHTESKNINIIYKNNSIENVNEIIVEYKNHEIAHFIKNEKIDFTIDTDYIKNIRSRNIQSEIFLEIGKQFTYFENLTEDSRINTLHSISTIFNTYIIDLNKKNNELILIALNSLLYSQSNVWYDTRVSLSKRVNQYFKNNSDNENELLFSLIKSEDHNTIYKIISIIPTIEIKDIYLNNNEFNEFIYSLKEELNQWDEQDYDNTEYFNDIQESIDYYQKNSKLL